MTTPLWDKGGAGADADAMAFMSRDDVLLDRELFLFDIRATRAHVRGLVSIGLISDGDGGAIDGSLEELAAMFADGRFVLDERFEDGHSAIESYLTERLGEAGKRVHLGRSRNDQVAVALRLYMIDALGRAGRGLISAGESALAVAESHAMEPMPGYTHLQRAVPSSVGLWMGSFAEGFAESAELCALTRRWLDSCPLGSAAGYGVDVALPGGAGADALGFGRVQVSPMGVQASRGPTEHQVVATLWQGMQQVRRLAWDLSLFSSEEYGFVTLGPGYVTGSSIMPNKKNPDMAELLRGACAVLGGAMAEIQQAVSLPSGYHRDLQVTKPPLIRAVKTATEAIGHVPGVIGSMTLHTERMSAAIDGPMLATDRAVELAASGVPFRDAYKRAAGEIEGLPSGPVDAGASVAGRVSLGGCGNLGLDRIAERIAQVGTMIE